jgi:hypothetical protein
MYLGGADLSWCSDYSQLYFIDVGQTRLDGIEDIPADAEIRSVVQLPNALVVYTVDCLHQTIRVAIYDSKPDASASEMLCGDAWIKVLETTTTFASGEFVVSSPSKSGIEEYLPRFKVPQAKMGVRVSWLDYEQDRYDSFRAKPDVIQVEMWPL